jgi:transposase
VTDHLTISILESEPARCQDTIPIVRQLKALFATIPEDELLSNLKVYYAGRKGYTYKVLWRTYVAMTILNLPSFAALIRALENNPYIAEACGVNGAGIPSKFAYSRFMRRLQVKHNEVLVRNIMRTLTRKCFEALPNFGKTVAIDSTDLKAWSNGGKRQKSDPDAGWIVKGDTNGKRKFVWGYKLHLLVDTASEVPIAANITRGNFADVNQATPLLAQARLTHGQFNPEHVLCDAGYSSARLRKAIRQHYGAQPIIKARKTDRWVVEETPEWQQIFDHRTAVERCFSRMKTQRRLNHVTVRSRRKVTVHSLIPVIVTQAMALAFPDTPRNCCLSSATKN